MTDSDADSEEGWGPNGRDDYPWHDKNALIRAVENEFDVAEVEYLLNRRVDPNVCDEHGDTPLIAAVSSCGPYQQGWDRAREIIDLLVQSRADVDHRTDACGTALGQAAYNGSWRAVEVLLRLSADVNLQDEDGATPLYSVVEGMKTVSASVSVVYEPYLKTAKMLLEHGANPHVMAHDGTRAGDLIHKDGEFQVSPQDTGSTVHEALHEMARILDTAYNHRQFNLTVMIQLLAGVFIIIVIASVVLRLSGILVPMWIATKGV